MYVLRPDSYVHTHYNHRSHLATVVLEGNNILLGVLFFFFISIFPQFLLVDRRAKIQSGERTTSFYWLLNDKHGTIGRMLSAVPSQYRLVFFITGQFGIKLFFHTSYLLNV